MIDNPRILRGVLAAITAALVVAGCSSGATTPPNTPQATAPAAAPTDTPLAPEHNAADVTFVQGMIPHHTQAVTMSQQAPQKAASPQVEELAARISAAQGPEIELMNRMLATWGAPAAGGMPGMGNGSMSGMAGMMTDQQLNELSAATGPAFDRMFLQMMISHHRGAIEMARTEQAQGQNPQAEQLAQAIIDAQQAEITEMESLLRQG